MWTPRSRGRTVPRFLVCAETAGPAGQGCSALGAALERWRASPCLAGTWLIEAPTTSRIVYDSLAAAITDADRLLVCELDLTALAYNLRNPHDGDRR